MLARNESKIFLLGVLTPDVRFIFANAPKRTDEADDACKNERRWNIGASLLLHAQLLLTGI